MTNEEIRIKIAESLGKCHHPREAIKSEPWEDGNDAGTDWTCTLCKKDPHSHPLPNYPESLDACAEFEKTLSGNNRDAYTNHLIMHSISDGDSHVLFATPLQRCLAYIKVKNL